MPVKTPLVRMVFSDMDGTFLATDKGVPQRNLLALDLLARQGVAFVPCTGRPASAVPAEVFAHAATRYVVGSNGAVVVDATDGRRMHVSAIDKQRVLALYDATKDLRITFDVFADGGVFAERARYEAMSTFGIDKPSLDVLRKVRKPVDLTVPHVVERVEAVEKVTCFWCTEPDREALLDAIRSVGGLSSTSGHPKNFELQAEGVNKATGMRWLCEHAGVPAAHVAAFGDEENDLALLRAAGHGVAMANAIATVRAAADYVTASNDEAGVARWLENHQGELGRL